MCNHRLFLSLLLVLCLPVSGICQGQLPGQSVRTQSTLTVCASGCDHTSIAAAIAAAASGDVIDIQEAVHTEAAIVVDKDLTLQGQGQTVTTVQAAASQDTAEDGVFIVNEGLTVIFQNLTVRHGNAVIAGSSFLRDGGGVYLDCSATTNVQFISVTITENRANDDGGGVFIEGSDGTVTFTNCVIAANEADQERTGSFGGGLVNVGASTLTLERCTLADNLAGGGGGALSSSVSDAAVTLSNCTVSNNTGNLADADFGTGGGLFFEFGNTFRIINATIVGNTLAGTSGIRLGGGIANMEEGDLELINTIVAHNSGASSTDRGDDIYMSSSGPSFTQTTSLVGDCDRGGGGTCPTFSYTDVTNIATTPSVCGVHTYHDINDSDAVGNGTAPGGDVPSADICEAPRSTLNSIGAFYRSSDPPKWTGLVSSDWFTAGNWSTGLIPTTTDAVTIDPGNNPAVIGTGSVTIANLVVSENGTFTLAEGASLTLTGGEDGLTADGTTNILGDLTVEEQSSLLGMSVGATCRIGANGSITLTELTAFVSDSLIVEGTFLMDNPRPIGLLLGEESVLLISAAGDCTIQSPNNTGISSEGNALVVEGMLTVTDTDGVGIYAFGGDFTVTETGVVSVTNNSGGGIAFAESDLRLDNSGTVILSDNGSDALQVGGIINRATATLRAEGNLDGRVTFAASSRLEPGSSPGCLTFEAATYLDEAVVAMEIEGTTACSDYDQIIFLDSLELNDATLELSGSHDFTVGETFTLFSAGGVPSLVGTFAGLPEGGTVELNGSTLDITYQGGSGKDVVLTCTAIPPVTYTWTGAEDSDWDNPNNWDLGAVPGEIDEAFIPSTSNDPLINSGFVEVGSVFITGAELTLASGTITRIQDQDTGLRVASGGTVTVNGPLIISGQQSEGLNLSNGTLTISATGRVEITDSYASVGDGLLEVNGELVITDAISNGLQLTGEGAIRIKETGSLQINNPANNGLVLTEEGSFEQLGTTTISGCGSNGLSIGEETTCTISSGAEVSISDCVGALISMSDGTSKVTNRGMLSLTDPGNFAASSGSISNEDGSELVLEGTLTSSLRAKAGSTLQIGADIGRTFHNAAADFREATVVIDIEGTTIGSTYDAIDFNSSVNLTDATLVLAGDYAPQLGDVFSIHTSSTFMASLTGTYSDLPDGATLLFNGAVLEINYQTSPGTLVTLTTIEVLEPLLNDDLINTLELSVIIPMHTVFGADNPGYATKETDEVDCGETVSWWYRYVPLQTADYLLNAQSITAPTPTEVADENDVTLAIYTGAGHPLVEVGCFDNNTTAGGGELETVALTAGETYYIRVGGKANTLHDEIATSITDATIVWTGAISDDWYTAGNWSTGQVPGTEDAVQINAGTNPAVLPSGNVTIASLATSEGSEFTLAEGANLTLSGGSAGLTTSGVTNFFGALTIEAQLSVLGAAIGERCFVGPTGSIQTNDLSNFLMDSLIVQGTFSADTPPFGGLIMNGDAVLWVQETGNFLVQSPGDSGLSHDGLSVIVAGTLTVDNGQGEGIFVDAGDFSITETGTVNITNTQGTGLDLDASNLLLDNSGALFIAGSTGDAINGGQVINRATATLRAEGNLADDVTFEAGSRLEPGSSPGCLLFRKDVDFGGVTLAFELEGTTACSSFDQIEFRSMVDIGGATLELSGDYVPQLSDTFLLMESGFEFSGVFAGLPNGGTVLFNGSLLEISYEEDLESATEKVVLRTVSVLPLDLLSFTGEARDKANILSWTTANEEDFSHFEVERSGEGVGPWSVLTQSDLQASGVTPTSPLSPGEGPGVRSYAYTDQSPLPTAYYRLKIIDLDGTFSYSEVVYLENNSGEAAGAMKVYPNPSNGRFTVNLSEAGIPANRGGELHLVDLHGRQIWSRRVSGDRAIELSHPSTGIYLLTLVTDDGYALTRRIVIR